MMAQHEDDIQFMPMSLTEHRAEDVAALIYESAPELFVAMFGPWAIGCLADFVERSHNRFSHRYIRVAVKAQQIIGIVTLVPAAKLSEDADDSAVLNGVQRWWLGGLRSLVLRHVLHNDLPQNSLYVGNLAVAAQYRSQGVGRRLLSQCIADAKAIASPLYISVDIHNSRAQKLYESLGFQVRETRTLHLLGTTVGSHLLVLVHSSGQFFQNP